MSYAKLIVAIARSAVEAAEIAAPIADDVREATGQTTYLFADGTRLVVAGTMYISD